MYKKILILLFLSLCSTAHTEQADDHQLIRRLYLDTLGRLPDIFEFKQANATLKHQNGYTQLVDQLLTNSEFKENLSWQISRHYGPEIKLQNTIGMERARLLIQKKYLNEGSDIRVLIKDIINARGIEAYNPLVRFYSYDDNSETLTNRFSERVLGMSLGCAKCHDHKLYPELLQKDYWGVSGFFQAAQIKYIKTTDDLKNLKKEVSRNGTSSLGEKFHLNTWRFFEEKKKDIFSDKKMAFLGSLPYPDNYYMMSNDDDSMMTKSDAEDLHSPQLIILEPQMSAAQIKITHQTEDYKYLTFKAGLPLQSKFNRSRDFPRTTIAEWMTGGESQFFDRAVVNWVSNWIMGQGLKMPVIDTYLLEDEHQFMFDLLIENLQGNKYNLSNFIRSLLLTREYKLRNKLHTEDGEGRSLRTFRYINGRQLANIFFHDQNTIRKPAETSHDFTEKAKLELKKVEFMLEEYPDALKPELHAPGTVSQAQSSAASSLWLNKINTMAQKAFFSKEKPETWIRNIYIELFTRYPSNEELNYLIQILKPNQDFENSNYKEVIWALVNSPEMRIY